MKDQQRIKNEDLGTFMSGRFNRYTKSIIQQRAIPRVEDGLKPVQRRILFAMTKNGNIYNKAYRKSAKAVGDVMGNLHPHGDSSIYKALIDMSQDWKMRAPLIDLHGNNGSIDDDPPAAMRYTEARTSKITQEMVRDIKKDTVGWVLNFDDTEYEPTVLPSRFPNLAVNGAVGISSGYATNIPPHNLGEVIDAVIYLQKRPNASLDTLLKIVKGPDFPTGGIVQGKAEMKKAYATGRGRILLSSRTHIHKLRNGRHVIKISEIPFGVNKKRLVTQIKSIQIDQRINGIEEVEDDSDRHGLMITIVLARGADARGTLAYLFKHTDLQIYYHYNVVVIDHMQPKQLGLKPILAAYLQFQRKIVRRRTRYDLTQLKLRQEIVKGDLKALPILSRIAKVIKNARGRKDTAKRLEKRFKFTTRQAMHVADLRLYRFNHINVKPLKSEDRALSKQEKYCRSILNSKRKLDHVLCHELLRIKHEFNTPRRTSIRQRARHLKITKKVTVPDEDVMVMVSHDGYIKRSSLRSYKASTKGDNGLKPGDYPLFVKRSNTRHCLYLFTNLGRVVCRPVNYIRETRWKDTGNNISQSIRIRPGERIIRAFCFTSLKGLGSYIIATNDGHIKRIQADVLKPWRTYKHHAEKCISLKNSSAHVIDVAYLPKGYRGCTVILATKYGFAARFNIKDIPVSGAAAAGNKSMSLSKTAKTHDTVCGMQLVKPDDVIATLTSKGVFTLFRASSVPLHNRGCKGNHLIHYTQSRLPDLVSFIKIDPLRPRRRLKVYTKYRREQDINPLGQKVQHAAHKGKKLVNVDKFGEPAEMRY